MSLTGEGEGAALAGGALGEAGSLSPRCQGRGCGEPGAVPRGGALTWRGSHAGRSGAGVTGRSRSSRWRALKVKPSFFPLAPLRSQSRCGVPWPGEKRRSVKATGLGVRPEDGGRRTSAQGLAEAGAGRCGIRLPALTRLFSERGTCSPRSGAGSGSKACVPNSCCSL